ncbi:MAG TPA: hypothetical protein PLL69_02070 [Gemmatimonadales bacterium]|nr:hypothetical protein [Gemmatimonadales bacterium]
MLERVLQSLDGSPHSFDDPQQIAIAEDGTIVIVDGRPGQLMAFSAGTGPPRLIASPGAGPGDVNHPMIALHGDTVVAYNGPLARLTRFTLDGNLIGQAYLRTNRIGMPVAVDGKNHAWIIHRSRASGGASSDQWIRYDSQGLAIDSITLPVLIEPRTWERVANEQATRWILPFEPSTRHLVRRRGDVVYGRTDLNEFIVTITGSDTIQIFGRSGTVPEPLTDSERDSVIGAALVRIGDKGDAKDAEVARTRPIWSTIREDGAENLWVEREPSRLASDGTVFDVYDRDGRFRGQVAAPFRSTRIAFSTDRVAVVDEDSSGLPRIQVFRIER